MKGHSEKSFAHPLGFGGKLDHFDPDAFKGIGGVVDFKSKAFTKDKLPDLWPNHYMQLAAYRMLIRKPNARCAIIFISTEEPGLVHTIEAKPDKLEFGWTLFLALLEVWKVQKKYDPSWGDYQ